MNGLDALEAELRRQLAQLNYPPKDWLPPTRGPGGEAVLDAAIIGAGMCGLTVAFGLRREGVSNIRLFDVGTPGREGPWVTYARMETLRSPKHLTSPDLGLPALTFRAFFEAQFGAAAWERLWKIDRAMWMDYLVWFRRVVDLPVENRVRLERISPASSLLRLAFSDGRTVLARKVVLATGRDGSGGRRIPDFVDKALGPDRVAHSADAIDFPRLAGKRVAVVGAGASAWDNAATAAEAGAAEVHLLSRRRALPQVNKFKAATYPGFHRGFYRLADAERWAITRYAFEAQTPPPRETVLRMTRQESFRLHLGAAVERASADGEAVMLATSAGPLTVDFLILGTGFTVDLSRRRELDEMGDAIALWRDRYTPPDGERSPELDLYPYLGQGFEFLERAPGTAPFLRDIHCFNYGAALSHGLLSGDIPGLQVGATRLAARLVEDLFAGSLGEVKAALQAAAEPELLDTPFHDPETIRRVVGMPIGSG